MQKQFTVKASKEAKQHKINCGGWVNHFDTGYEYVENPPYPEIVLLVNGKVKYKGDMYNPDCRKTFEQICNDPSIYDLFTRFCNSFGDPIWEVDGTRSPKSLGGLVWQIVLGDYAMLADPEESYDFYEDFGADSHYNDPQVECFLSEDMV